MKIFNYMIAGGLVLGTMSLCLTSCDSDYLNTTPTESVSTGDAVGTAENAYKVLNGIARTMSTQQNAWTQGCAGENRVIAIYENYASENYLFNAYAQGWADIMNLRYSLRNNTSYAAYPWFYYYNIIGQANTIIAHIDEAEGDQELKDFDKAAALTFRAYGYEKLMHYYCPRWQDSNNGAEKKLVLRLDESIGDMPPSSMADVYAQIYSDLDEAIKLFSGSSVNRASSEIWIPNLNVAHAVYARAALTKQDYATALTHAAEARKDFPLMSNDAYQAGFCKPTSEWIFGSYGDAQENNWYWSYGTQFAANGYFGSNTAYGSGQINSALTDLIPNTDVRKHLFLTGDKIGWGDSTAINLTAENDPDAYAKAVAYMDSIHDKYASGLAPYYKGFKKNKSFLMGSHWKFLVFDDPGVGYLPFIRSSEMLLIEAEANYFLKKDAAAQASLVELNAKSGRNPEYTCTLTGDNLFKEIRKYREIELWGEGFGFSDAKRWNLPIDRKAGRNVASAVKVRVESTDDNWIWAIPQYETDYNDGYSDTTKEK